MFSSTVQNVVSPVNVYTPQDGHPEVESECRSLVKYIEGVLGESIESYLV